MRRITIYRVLAVLALVAFFAFVFALSSCGTAKTIVKEGEVRTEYVDRFREHRDSIYLHDSVYIHFKGDTVYQERWHTRIRDRTVRDTVYIQKVDSIYVDRQVKKTSGITEISYTLRLLGCAAVVIAVLLFILKLRGKWK